MSEVVPPKKFMERPVLPQQDAFPLKSLTRDEIGDMTVRAFWQRTGKIEEDWDVALERTYGETKRVAIEVAVSAIGQVAAVYPTATWGELVEYASGVLAQRHRELLNEHPKTRDNRFTLAKRALDRLLPARDDMSRGHGDVAVKDIVGSLQLAWKDAGEEADTAERRLVIGLRKSQTQMPGIG